MAVCANMMEERDNFVRPEHYKRIWFKQKRGLNLHELMHDGGLVWRDNCVCNQQLP